jgi:hypothetical protein
LKPEPATPRERMVLLEPVKPKGPLELATRTVRQEPVMPMVMLVLVTPKVQPEPAKPTERLEIRKPMALLALATLMAPLRWAKLEPETRTGTQALATPTVMLGPVKPKGSLGLAMPKEPPEPGILMVQQELATRMVPPEPVMSKAPPVLATRMA